MFMWLETQSVTLCHYNLFLKSRTIHVTVEVINIRHIQATVVAVHVIIVLDVLGMFLS